MNIEYTRDFTVFPSDINTAGTLFGGKLLCEMDISGATLARKILYKTEADVAVTASMDKVDFITPSHIGDIITIKSKLKSLGRSSMVIESNVWKETKNGDILQICKASFTFVAIKDCKPYIHGLSFNNIEFSDKYKNM